jgi:hypothetical protein
MIIADQFVRMIKTVSIMNDAIEEHANRYVEKTMTVAMEKSAKDRFVHQVVVQILVAQMICLVLNSDALTLVKIQRLVELMLNVQL